MEQAKSKRRQILVALGLVGGVLTILGFIKYIQVARAIAQSQSFLPPPEAVTSIVAEVEEWPRTISAVGSLMPHQGVTVSTELEGKVVSIGFESGAAVKQGDLLVELDTSVERSQLLGAQARLDRAVSAFDRSKRLVSSNAISKDTLETAESEFRQAQAAVDALQAQIDKKRITAPFSGRAGIRMVNVGAFLKPGDAVVPLHELDPLFVNFSVPQREVGEIAPAQKVSVRVDSYPDELFHGTVSAVNPQVDMLTRNVEIQAVIANKDERLRPGMFAKVELILPKIESAVTVPATSINFAPYGDSVYVIEKMKDPGGEEYLGVRQQIVHLGDRRGDQVAIVDGVKPGEEIVTSGMFKLRPGARVVVNNAFAPENDPAPKPQDT